jgi:hypothetical protein
LAAFIFPPLDKAVLRQKPSKNPVEIRLEQTRVELQLAKVLGGEWGLDRPSVVPVTSVDGVHRCSFCADSGGPCWWAHRPDWLTRALAEPSIVEVAGRSSSGKTTLLRRVAAEYAALPQGSTAVHLVGVVPWPNAPPRVKVHLVTSCMSLLEALASIVAEVEERPPTSLVRTLLVVDSFHVFFAQGVLRYHGGAGHIATALLSLLQRVHVTGRATVIVTNSVTASDVAAWGERAAYLFSHRLHLSRPTSAGASRLRLIRLTKSRTDPTGQLVLVDEKLSRPAQ